MQPPKPPPPEELQYRGGPVVHIAALRLDAPLLRSMKSPFASRFASWTRGSLVFLSGTWTRASRRTRTPHPCTGALSRSANIYARIEVGDRQHLAGLSHNPRFFSRFVDTRRQFGVGGCADVVEDGGGVSSCVPHWRNFSCFFPPLS